MAAYANVDDILDRCDVRTLGMLCSDDEDPLTVSELQTSARLLAALEDASGEVEAALISSARYSAADLAGLTGNSLALLKKIVCVVAVANLFNLARPGLHAEAAKVYFDQAQNYLKMLQSGANLFNLADGSNVAAAHPEVSGPSSVDYQNMNLLPEQMQRYFPDRRTRMPLDRVY